MERFFLCVLSLSLSGALTGLVVLLLHPFTKKWFSRKWNYYIWLLLVARLLLPVHFETAGSLHIPEFKAGAGDAALSEAKAGAADLELTKLAGDTGQVTDNAGQIAGAAVDAESPGKSEKGEDIEGGNNPVSVNWLSVLAVIWLLGAGISFLAKGISYGKFTAYICKNSNRVTEGRILVLAEKTAVRLPVKKAPDIYASKTVSGPITLGLKRPMVILPEDFVQEFSKTVQKEFSEQLSLVLHHEFIHVKRKDLWYKWLYQILLCIHWFNPVLYLVGKKLNIDCELACDEAVLGKLTADGKRAYGNILINAAERNICFKGDILSTTLLGRRKDLKERLKGIIHYKKPGKAKILASLCMVCCLFCLSACGSVQVSRDAMPVRFSASDSAASFLAGVRAAKHGTGWKMYDDDSMIAGEDDHDQWQAFSYAGGYGRVSVKGFAISGSDSVLIVRAEEERKMKVESSYNLKAGKFKLVLVKPDKSVELIDDTGEWGIREITLEKGRNVIKMVGQGAKLEDLEIVFDYKEKDFEAVYNSEQEEYADKSLESIKAGDVDKEKVFESLAYMEDEMVSDVFAEMLAQKVPLTSDEICDLFIYSDAELSGRYLIQAIEKGDFIPAREMVMELMPYLQKEIRGSLLKALGADLDWKTICDSMPYLEDDERKEALLAYMENGNTITFSQYTEIVPYLSDGVAEELDRYMEQK